MNLNTAVFQSYSNKYQLKLLSFGSTRVNSINSYLEIQILKQVLQKKAFIKILTRYYWLRGQDIIGRGMIIIRRYC